MFNEDANRTSRPCVVKFPKRAGEMPLFAFLCISSLSLALLALGCGSNIAVEPQNRTTLSVATAVVRHQPDFSYSVNYYGRVEPARSTELSFELAGQLQEVTVDEGDAVGAGAVVARLDTSLLDAEKQILLAERGAESAILERMKHGERDQVIDAARAEVKRLEVEQARLAADRGRAEKVFAGRSISRSEYDGAVFSFEAAAHSLERARKRLEELTLGNRIEDIQAQESRVAATDARLDLLKVRLSKSLLRAPFDGVCVRRFLDEGAALSPGQVVLQLNEANRVEARFSVPQQNLALIDQAKHVTINGTGHLIREVRKVLEVDQITRTVDLVIPLETQAGDGILPGQTCTLEVTKRVAAECIELPLSALVASVRGLWSCYRLEEDPVESGLYTVEKRDVSILHTDGERVFVSPTLPDQSLIVVEGSHKITPSMQVRIVEH
jgi:multidrug efflux pump subunit AcrA (membrane-fusion protein)